jgi:hypothetical protein
MSRCDKVGRNNEASVGMVARERFYFLLDFVVIADRHDLHAYGLRSGFDRRAKLHSWPLPFAG